MLEPSESYPTKERSLRATSSSIPDLPVELLEAIVCHINPKTEAGRQTLRSCSYTGRTLLAVSQRSLLQDTTLVFGMSQGTRRIVFVEGCTPKGKNLLRLVKNSPHFALYIRRIVIAFSPSISTDNYSDSSDSSSASFPLYSILPDLPCLEEVAFVGPRHCNWANFEPTIWTHLREVGRLSKLDMRPINNVPTSFLAECRSLQELHIASVIVEQSVMPSAKLKLKVLNIHTGGMGINTRDGEKNLFAGLVTAISPLDLSHLTRLVISILDLSYLQNLLRLCRNTLETLDLDLGLADTSLKAVKLSYESGEHIVPSYGTAVPDLSKLHRLRTLKISSRIRVQSITDYVIELPYACAIANTLPRRSSVRGTVEVICEIIVINMPTHRLASIPWAAIIGTNLPDEIFESIPLRLKLLFLLPMELMTPPSRTRASNLLDELDKDEYLVEMKRRGLLTCSTYGLTSW